jgi:hypothetical protein
MDKPLMKRTHHRLPHGKAQVRVSLRWSIRVGFCLFSLLRRRRQDSNLIVRVHLRPGEQVSGTVVFAILHREKSNKVFGSALRATTPKRLLHLRVFGKRSSRDCSQTATSSTSWWLFEGLHYVHLPASTRTTTSTEVIPRLVWLI